VACPFPIKNNRYRSPTRHTTRPMKTSCLAEGWRIRGRTWDDRLKCQEAGNRQEMLILSNTEGRRLFRVSERATASVVRQCAGRVHTSPWRRLELLVNKETHRSSGAQMRGELTRSREPFAFLHRKPRSGPNNNNKDSSVNTSHDFWGLDR